MTTRNRILIGVTGGIAAYKALDLVSALRKDGHQVNVIMTTNATHFVGPLAFETLSHNAVITDLFESNFSSRPDHIALKNEAKLMVVVPATANCLAKSACGLADDALSTTILAVAGTCPILFAPAMNTDMWENPLVQRNIETLKSLGHHFIDPVEGELACGDTGCGKLADVEDIYQAIKDILKT